MFHENQILSQNIVLKKQSGINRYAIAGPNEIMKLSVPICHEDKLKPQSMVRINYQEKWIKTHKQAWQTAYGKSPFFEFYDYKFFSIFDANVEYLGDFNAQLLRLLLLQLKVPIQCVQFKNDCATEHQTSSSTLEIESLPYSQVFDAKFGFRQPVSAIDLLFNIGPMISSHWSTCLKPYSA